MHRHISTGCNLIGAIRPLDPSASTLKVELVHDAVWAMRAAARAEPVEYLELFYNGQRRHSALGCLSPQAFARRREHPALATRRAIEKGLERHRKGRDPHDHHPHSPYYRTQRRV